MVVRFKKVRRKLLYKVSGSGGRELGFLDGMFEYWSFFHTGHGGDTSSEELRAIADKLDALNTRNKGG